MRCIAQRASIPALVSVLTLVAGCGDEVTKPQVTPPAISSIAPDHGTVGTEVQVSGSAFSADGVDVYFGDIASPSIERDGDAIFATAPEGLSAGTTYDVRVVNADGGADTLTASFEAVPPSAGRVNGVTRPTGLRGMTVIVEGDAFGDLAEHGAVYFEAADGTPVRATIADSAADWTNTFVVTSVPDAVGDTSRIWVETPTGASDSIPFRLVGAAAFSPSTIHWTETTALPQPLQGLGAVFVPIEDPDAPANYVFTIGGADSATTPTGAVYRSLAQESGEVGTWETPAEQLPEPRAYAATAAATAYTAALDTLTTAAYLYALGGQDSASEAVSTVYVAHVDRTGAVDAWQTTTELPQPLHSAGAAVFRGYLYLAGGADTTDAATADVYRAKVDPDGTLGDWETLPSLMEPSAYGELVSFGPYLYMIGGDAGASAPVGATVSNTETAGVYVSRVDLRDGLLTDPAWSAVAAMNKARSKHSAIFAGGSLFVTSGVYSGQAGSSENIYSNVANDGTLGGWNGATGDNTIDSLLGYSLYNQAAISFVDASGTGHVLVLGGADREAEGQASAAVVYY